MFPLPATLPTHVEFEFPKLAPALYTVASETTVHKIPWYNCIAYAADDDQRPWWPDPYYQYHWPIPYREESVACFLEAFREMGYRPCGNNQRFRRGWDKIALYVDDDEKPTHMAKQLGPGLWGSKVGPHEDIQHGTLEVLTNLPPGDPNRDPRRPGYGRVRLILKRRQRPTALSLLIERIHAAVGGAFGKRNQE